MKKPRKCLKKCFSAFRFSLGLFAFFFVSPSYGAPGPSLPQNYLPLPIERQATSYSCGAAALQSLLIYWGVYDGTEKSLYKLLGTTAKEGTHPRMIEKVAQKFGLEASLDVNVTLADLRSALTRGETVILDIQAWYEDTSRRKYPEPDRGVQDWKNIWDSGHYVNLIAMDEHYIYVMDPSVGSGYGYIPIPEFLDRWHDYENKPALWRYQHLAIFIRGKSALKYFPGPLVRIE